MAGALTVTLSGVAPNCVAREQNPQTIQLQSGQNASVTFHVFCAAVIGGSNLVLFMSTRDDPTANPYQYEIYAMKADGSVTRLTNNHFFDGFPTFSPDGQKIVFASDRDGNREIYVMNADGSGVQRLTTTDPTADDRYPSWSPDGSKILFVSNRDGDSEIFVMNADGSNPTQLTNNVAGDDEPRFSSDGTKIVFTSNRDAPDPRSPTSHWEIYSMNADGSAPTRLTSDQASNGWPMFSKDGSKIIFDGDRLGHNQIFIMNADGSGITRLTQDLSTDFLAVWSPDESHILFTSYFTGHWEVYQMKPDGTAMEQLTITPGNVTNVGYSYRP